MTETTKMTFKVQTRLWENFSQQMARLPVSRDRFLNQVISRETPRLEEAMGGKRLTSKASGHVSASLQRLGCTTVNITVDKSVASALQAVVKETNMVRDAFFNRMIIFLRSTDKILTALDLPKEEDRTVGKGYGPLNKPTSPMATLEQTFDDPLWYLQMAANERHGLSLYLLDFPGSDTDGLACWLDDTQVPTTRAYRKHRRDLAEMFSYLEDFETETLLPKTGQS